MVSESVWTTTWYCWYCNIDIAIVDYCNTGSGVEIGNWQLEIGNRGEGEFDIKHFPGFHRYLHEYTVYVHVCSM